MTNPAEKNLFIQFQHKIDQFSIRKNQDVQLSDGRRLRFQYIRHIFTNIYLINEQGDTVYPSLRRVLIRENETEYALGKVLLPTGQWKMYLLYGVDSLTNKTIQPSMVENAGDPLAPQFPSMYWTWESGYLFTRIEALADTSRVPSGQLNGFVDYHLGKTGLARWIGPFEVRVNNEKATINLNCDLQPAFQSIIWPEEFSSHTFENVALAEKILNHIAQNIKE
ncbi:MAG: MbnP family protein [Thermaurantimonas sp.]